MRDTQPIVTFKTPPLVEVACGVQFEKLPLSMAHFGLFWHQIKSTFPTVQDGMPLVPIIERQQGTPPQDTAEVEFEVLPDTRRLMLFDMKREHLIQMQNNRFHHNWRKQGESDVYPRFNEVLSGFLGNWSSFESFLCNEGLSPPKIIQCEMTYVNHVESGSLWSKQSGFTDLFPWIGTHLRLNDNMPDIECALRFPMPERRGRLHVTVKTGKRMSDKVPVVVLDLTLRGALQSGQEQDGLREWFASAREYIVDAFVKLTGPKAHEAWGIEA